MEALIDTAGEREKFKYDSKQALWLCSADTFEWWAEYVRLSEIVKEMRCELIDLLGEELEKNILGVINDEIPSEVEFTDIPDFLLHVYRDVIRNLCASDCGDLPAIDKKILKKSAAIIFKKFNQAYP